MPIIIKTVRTRKTTDTPKNSDENIMRSFLLGLDLIACGRNAISNPKNPKLTIIEAATPNQTHICHSNKRKISKTIKYTVEKVETTFSLRNASHLPDNN